jgi:hypothetical protein
LEIGAVVGMAVGIMVGESLVVSVTCNWMVGDREIGSSIVTSIVSVDGFSLVGVNGGGGTDVQDVKSTTNTRKTAKFFLMARSFIVKLINMINIIRY